MILPRIVCSSGSVSSPNLGALGEAVSAAASSVQAQFFSRFLDEPCWSAVAINESGTCPESTGDRRSESE